MMGYFLWIPELHSPKLVNLPPSTIDDQIFLLVESSLRQTCRFEHRPCVSSFDELQHLHISNKSQGNMGRQYPTQNDPNR